MLGLAGAEERPSGLGLVVLGPGRPYAHVVGCPGPRRGPSGLVGGPREHRASPGLPRGGAARLRLRPAGLLPAGRRSRGGGGARPERGPAARRRVPRRVPRPLHAGDALRPVRLCRGLLGGPRRGARRRPSGGHRGLGRPRRRRRLPSGPGARPGGRELGSSSWRRTRGRCARPGSSWPPTRRPAAWCRRSVPPCARPSPERLRLALERGASLPTAARTADGRIAWQVRGGRLTLAPTAAGGAGGRARLGASRTSPRVFPWSPAARVGGPSPER